MNKGSADNICQRVLEIAWPYSFHYFTGDNAKTFKKDTILIYFDSYMHK